MIHSFLFRIFLMVTLLSTAIPQALAAEILMESSIVGPENNVLSENFAVESPPGEVVPPESPPEGDPLPVDFSSVLLNEVDLETEFIELWNSGAEELDLSTFQFSELSGASELRHSFSEFSQSLTLPPNEFLILSMSRKLNNSGEVIKIYQTPESLEPLQILEVPPTQIGKSYAREQNGNFVWALPTPGAINFAVEDPLPELEDPPEIPEPLPSPDFQYLVLNEVSLEGEFIELFNSGAIELDLQEFEFSELSGSSEIRRKFTDFTSDPILPAQGYMLLGMERLLNNSGETIKIYASTEAQTALVELLIPENQAAKSYSRQSDKNFLWTPPTPGALNASLEGETPVPEPPGETIPANEDFSGIVINEVDLEAEFIEIKNLADIPLDLNSFQFSELSGANELRHDFTDFTTDLVLDPQSFLLISLSSKLNNSGDTIGLYVHPGVTTALQILEIPAGKSGYSFARTAEGEYSWTDTPTPLQENIIHLPPSAGTSTSTAQSNDPTKFFDPPAQTESLDADTVEILISEVAFKNSKHDLIELFCQSCGTAEEPIDLQGFRLFDDDSFFEFPMETFIQSGEYVVLSLKSDREQREKTAYGWNFFGSHKGLTATDETIFLVDSKGKIEDAVCWGDHNGKFSAGEREDVGYMVVTSAWKTEQHLDFQCFPSLSISGKMSMARQHGSDTDSAPDFFPTTENTFGAPNPEMPIPGETVALRIASLLILSDAAVLLEIENEAAVPATLHGFAFKNIKKTLFEIPDMTIPTHSRKSFFLKKFPLQNNFLLLTDAWGNPEDFWCLNPPRAGFLNEAGSELLHDLERKGFWKEREFSSCLFGEFLPGTLLRVPSRIEALSAADFQILATEEKPMTDATELIVSRVMPNPKGADKKQEWIEIEALEDIPDLSSWFLLIGSRVLPLPQQILQAGAALKLEAENFSLPTLKNSAGEIALLSPQGQIFKLFWEKAKDDAVLQIIAGQLFWDIPVTEQLAQKSILKKENTPKELIFHGDEIEAEIVSVLPNPEGKDVDQETIVLRNTSGIAGFLRYFQFFNGKKKVVIPDTFFASAEEKAFFGKGIVPNLKNKDGLLQLLDPSGKSVDEVSWQKARDGELFGKDIVWTKKVKKSSSKKKKTSATKSKKKPEEKTVSGILESFTEQELVMRLTDGTIRQYRFSEKSPQSLFFLKKVLSAGTPIDIVLTPDEEIVEFRTDASLKLDWILSGPTFTFWSLPAAIFLSFLGLSIFVVLRKIRSFPLFIRLIEDAN